MIGFLKHAALLMAGLYVLVVALLFIFQRDLLYIGRKYTDGRASPPAGFQEFPVTTADGLHLHGWYAPSQKRKKTIVFFHGNGDGLATITPALMPFVEQGFGVLVCEYRGYSSLAGTPSEQGLYADARAYIEALKIKANDIVLMAHSLGTGVAVQMATEYDAAGLILLAPYTNMVDAAATHYPFVPARWLVRDRFDSLSKISKIHAPLLVVHGDSDTVIPVKLGRTLFEQAQTQKQFTLQQKHGHNDLFDDTLYNAAFKWLHEPP